MKLFAVKEAEAFLLSGARELRHGRELRVTPAARDLLVEAGVKVVFDAAGGGAPSLPAAPAPAAAPGLPGAPAGPAGPAAAGDPARLFVSAEAQRLKEEICEMGRRCWHRDYNDGNGGNLSARLGGYFLCTPTGVSKGFMKPEMLCLVDAEGNQVAGNGSWKRTSEILSHLGIYRAVPAAMAVVHAHPIHATAFAMAGIEPPQCLIPEVEVFVGTIPVAEYKTPGSPQMSEVLGRLAPQHQSILMGNHGVICWGTSVEDAYFKMEITDSYCRTLWVAAQLPSNRTAIPADEMKVLLDLKKKMGLPDERHGYHPVQLCEVDPWEALNAGKGCSTRASAPDLGKASDAEIEGLVQRLTDEILASLSKK